MKIQQIVKPEPVRRFDDVSDAPMTPEGHKKSNPFFKHRVADVVGAALGGDWWMSAGGKCADLRIEGNLELLLDQEELRGE